MFHLAAFFQSVDPAGVFVSLAAPNDQAVTVETPNILVPTLNQLILAAAGVETAAAQQARIAAPSLRVLGLQRVAPTQGATAGISLPGDPPNVADWRASPRPLVAGEAMTFDINSNPAAAQIQWGLVWFADAPPAPVRGNIFSVRATTATAAVAGAWTAGALAFAEQLPRGHYQVVGLRSQSANLIAARLVFVGPGAAGWRPGVLGTASDAAREFAAFRYGELGVFGEFEDTQPPQLEVLAGAADAAQVVTLDLIQTRSGPGGA